ncbi:T-cell-specific guanine nucleotide triphosphate-binding protein 2-like [Mercenaria mercenaria]|uniref:T-cell-specific guanine nucleotide triphosphate-binding protein 2-like n=1 Tax=Mercenaria mercenaria TaxID=6596 RepID=UPI00234E8FA9|nr:T-cell-specific guanine nucleotide triphosphate-binding protein 2-like [Mercenaria mercenaria]
MASFDGNKFSGLNEKVKQLKSYYDRGGIPGLERQLKKQLNEWKDVHIKIAVTGRSGVGKSSFINAIRGITADDPGAAKVDVKECTASVQEYVYPDNNNFRIYDLPGLGTPHFQTSTYLADVNFEQYDFFIILTETRFMNEDLWLAQQVEEKGKHFYFVRSKIDNDVRSDKRAHPRTHNEAALMNVIKENLESNLKMFSRKDIFLIDNYDTQSYEFGRLTSKLMEDSNEIKQDVLAFSLTCLSNEVIEEKKKTLQRRIPLISYFAGAFANVFNPAKSRFVLKEVQFYGEQFRVDTASLVVGGVVCNLSEDEKETVAVMMNSHDKTMSEKMRQSLVHVINYIPIVGNIAVGIKCAKYLEKCLDETAKRAKEIHGLMTESLAKKYTS